MLLKRWTWTCVLVACAAAAGGSGVCAGAQTAAVAGAAGGATQATAPLPQTGSPNVSTGRVSGVVADPTAAVIPGATITFTSSTGQSSVATSGSDGSYSVALPPGTYSAIFAMPGFSNLQRTGIRVTVATTTHVDAKLAVGEQTQVITVTADAAQVGVDSDNNASSTIIKGKDLDALSDDPDELQSELTALAGPAAGPNGGQIYIDGFTGGQLPPKSTIREIRINQNPFSAQYDKVGFGRIEVFTKPGTDKIRVYVSVQGNEKPLNTSTPFLGNLNSQPNYFSVFSSGNVSGPLNKAASYNTGYFYRDTQLNTIVDPAGFYAASATSTTPCQPGQTGCAVVGYPLGARAVNQPASRLTITPRIDLAFGSKNVLSTRYQFQRSTNSNQGVGGNVLPSAGYESSGIENEIQISDTQTISERTINETRFEYERQTSNQTPNTTTPQVVVQGNFSFGGNATQQQSSVASHIELQNYTSLARGSHFILFGGRLRNTSEDLTSFQNRNATLTYNYLLDPCTDPTVTTRPSNCVNTTTTCANPGVSSYQCNTPSQLLVSNILQPTVHARSTDVGLYAEDQWKVRPNFTFNYGVRYEAQNEINSGHDIAPRLSLAYGIPRAGGKPPLSVIRAGFGLFYDRFAIGDFLTVAQLQPNVQQQQTTLFPNGATCTPNAIAGQSFATIETLCGTSTQTTSGTASARFTQYGFGPNVRASYTIQSALGLDQQLGKLGTLSVNYLNENGDRQYLTTVTPTSTAYLRNFQSEGEYRENQVISTINIRTKNLTLFGYYALTFANANTSGSSFVPTSSNLRVDYGRAAFDQKQGAAFGGNYEAPYHISISPFAILRSGQPFNVTTGTDVNGDSVYNDRPAFSSTPNAGSCIASDFQTPATNTAYTEIPINYCLGPTAITFNLRVQKDWGFGPRTGRAAAGQGAAAGANGGGAARRGPGGGGGGGRGGPPPPGGGQSGAGYTGRKYNIGLGAQAQNLFNNINYAPPVSTLSSKNFGAFQSLVGRPFSQVNSARTISLQLTFNF